jgi:hypothetical protein
MTTDLEPIEWVEQHIGTGDGCTVHFSAQVHHRPIEPGTLKAFMLPGGVLDLMIGLEGRKPIDDDQLQVNEKTGVLTASFVKSASTGNSGSVTNSPPPLGEVIWIRYAWRPPRLRDAQIRIKLNGKKEWVSVRELQDAFHRSDRPWPDQLGGTCRGPCRGH